MTNDSIHTYTFDAENRVKAVDATAASYTYSGPMRIKKVQGATNTVYIFSGSKVIAEYVNGALSREYIYLGNQLLYTVRYGAVDTYHHFDHLSTRIETRTDGTAERGYAHFPFGETWYESGPDVPGAQKYKFTSYERDQESGLDQAMFRYYSPRIGRFMSADLLAGSLRDPQSLNRYSYVGSDPVNFRDPLGLDGDDDDGCTWDPKTNTITCPPPLVPPYDASRGGGPDAFDNFIGWLRWRGFFALLQSVTSGTSPEAGWQDCPSKAGSVVKEVALTVALPQVVDPAKRIAAATGAVLQVGLGAAGTYPIPESGSPVGVSGTVSATLVFDPAGNIGLALSYGGGVGIGGGYVAGPSVSYSPRAGSIFDVRGPTTAYAFGGGAGRGGFFEASKSAGGTVTFTVGAASGGFGAAGVRTTTVLVPLVCR
jgi:RHS repeat-associated protein